MKFLALLVVMVILMLPVSAYAQQQLQQPAPSRLDIIGTHYSGPAFLDAFWTNRTSPPPTGEPLERVEVGPGDGVSVLAVTAVNRGFSEITAINGLLTLPSGFRAAGSGSSQVIATHNNIVPAGGVFTLFFQVDVSGNTSIREYTAPLKVEYSRTIETGTPRSSDLSVPFKVTGKTIVDASSQGGVAPGASGRVPIEITNIGSAPATGVMITVPGSSGVNPTTQQAALVSLGQKTFELGVISPGESKSIAPTFYVANMQGESLQVVDLNVTYGNAYGERKVSIVPVGLVVLPEGATSPVSVAAVGGSSVITAGKIADLRVSLANNRDQALSDVVVSVSSLSESIRILGNSSWTVGDVDPRSSQELSTKVFAARDMIGRATTFTFTVQHLSEGHPEIETIDLGTYVDGEISIRAYDIGVTYIGSRPNITGNLLNEGNVLSLFTTVELVSADNLVETLPPQQYLGDLNENSPLPFSIPIDVSQGVREGTYPVEIRVQYRDSLREPHVLDLTADVYFAPETPSTNESQVLVDASTVGIAGGIAAMVGIGLVVMRTRSRTKLKRKLQFSKQNGGQDIESVLDSQLSRQEENK